MPIKLKGLNEASEPANTGNGDFTDYQNVKLPDFTPPTPSKTLRQLYTPRTYEGVEYYGAEDVAKIIGVSKPAVIDWHKKNLFTADARAHDGRYLYTVERVEQLKSVYHPKWMRGGYEPSPTTTEKSDFTDCQKVTPCKPDGFGQVPADQFDAEYLRLIKLDLEESLKHRHEMPKDAKRGLYDATLDFFHVGYLPNWVLTKSRAEFNCGTYVDKETGEVKHLPPSSARMIVPTMSGNHFNAVATPEERDKIPKDFWKQHAGEKELFGDPDALKAPTVLVLEGEVDAMTIWQASKGKIPVIAILGASNWKKTLLPILDDCRKFDKATWEYFKTNGAPQRFVLMLDGDATGKKNGERLQAELLKRGYPAVYRSFYDLLMRRGEKIYKQDKKIDANDYYRDLKGKGANDRTADSILNTYIQANIINDAKDELDKLEVEIKQGKYAVEDKPTNTEFSAGNSDINADEIKLMLKNFVHAKDLTRDEWWAVGAILFRYGFTVDDFKKWSDVDDPRYSAESCESEWNSYASTIPKLENGDGYKIGTLIQLAKKYGYVPPRRDPHITGDKEIDEWQKVNGVIHPELLADLKTAAAKITAFEAVTAAQANDITLLKCLGAMQYYSPFGHVTRQFVIKLTDAKSDAKKKIALHKKDASTPEPTDVDKELAALDLAAVKKKIEQNYRLAKKNHEKYVQVVRRQEVVNQRNEQHDANVSNPTTTKTNVPNCPVDLILPEKITFDETGIKLVDNDRLGEEFVIEACQNPIVPTKIFREPATNLTKYEVSIMNAGKWYSTVVDGKIIQDGRSVSVLGNYGAHITDPKSIAKFFAKIIAANEDNGRLPHVRMFNKPGWHGNEFIYPATENADYVVMRSGIDYASIFSTRGNAEKWRDKFFEVSMSQTLGSLKRIVLGACLAAPLITTFQIMNPQFNMWGTSNFSKTPIIKLGLSLYGDPTEGQLMRTWNSSSKNIMTMSAGFNDFPIFLDEGESMSKKAREEFSEYVYNYSTGIINQNNKRNGDVRPVEKFHSVRLSTAERPLHNTSDKRGSYKRLIDLHVSKPLFNDSYGRRLHIFCGENFGLYGRDWVQTISEHREEFVQTFNNVCDRFERSGFRRNGENVEFSSVDPTNARAVIGCGVAFYKFFRSCLGFTENEYVYDDMISDIAEMLAELPTVDDISDVNRSVDRLRVWVASNHKRFIKPINSDGETDSYAPDAGRILAGGTVAIYTTVFEEVCDAINVPSARKFVHDLLDAGLLICKDRQHLSKSIRNQAKLPARAYYIFLGETEQQNNDDIDDEAIYING